MPEDTLGIHFNGSPDVTFDVDAPDPIARKLDFQDAIEDIPTNTDTADDDAIPVRPNTFDEQYTSPAPLQAQDNQPTIDFRTLSARKKINALQQGINNTLSPSDTWYTQQPWSVRRRIVESFFIDSEAKCVKLHDEAQDFEAQLAQLKVEKATLSRELEAMQKEKRHGRLSLKKVQL